MNNQSQILSSPHFKNVGVPYSQFLRNSDKNQSHDYNTGQALSNSRHSKLSIIICTNVKLPVNFLIKTKVYIYIFCYLFPTEKYLKVISNKKCLSRSAIVMCFCQSLPQLLQ